MNVLFVNTNISVLEGLENLFYRMRAVWHMKFAAGSEQALALLEQDTFDVVVSDSQMSTMSGLEFLQCLRRNYPDSIRIVLTGEITKTSLHNLFGLAHKILSKPAKLGELHSAIERVVSMKNLLNNDVAYRAAANIERLPSAPKVYSELLSLIQQENFRLDDVAALIERDPAIAARMLQIANSSAYNLVRNVTSVRDALAYIGLDECPNIVLSSEMTAGDGEGAYLIGVSVEDYQRHSFATACLAGELIDDKSRSRIAFISALLLHVGAMVMATELPGVIEPAFSLAKEERISLHSAELKLNGFCHCEIGAYILAMWGLPLSIVEVVAGQHKPSSSNENGFTVTSAVRLADYLCGTDGWLLGTEESTLDVSVDYLGGLEGLKRCVSRAKQQG